MAEQNKRDSFLIYRSFIEAGRGIESKKDRLSFYEAIFDFALENKINELQGSAKGMFILVKPQLEANRKKYDNGSKAKQNGSKTEANYNQTDNKVEANVNENVNVNENENNNENEPPILENRLHVIEEMYKEFTKVNSSYAKDSRIDYPAIKLFAEFIANRQNDSTEIVYIDLTQKHNIVNEFSKIANWYKNTNCTKSLETLAKFEIQKIFNELPKTTFVNSNHLPKVDMSKYDDYYLNPIKAK